MHQDWKDIVLRVKKNNNINSPVQTVEKTHGDVSTRSHKLRKIENEDEDFHHKKIAPKLRNDIIQARTRAKMTQQELAQAINVKPQTIQDIERGTAIYDSIVLSKLAKRLNIKINK